MWIRIFIFGTVVSVSDRHFRRPKNIPYGSGSTTVLQELDPYLYDFMVGDQHSEIILHPENFSAEFKYPKGSGLGVCLDL
jgi:hypothetical protein